MGCLASICRNDVLLLKFNCPHAADPTAQRRRFRHYRIVCDQWRYIAIAHEGIGLSDGVLQGFNEMGLTNIVAADVTARRIVYRQLAFNGRSHQLQEP